MDSIRRERVRGRLAIAMRSAVFWQVIAALLAVAIVWWIAAGAFTKVRTDERDRISRDAQMIDSTAAKAIARELRRYLLDDSIRTPPPVR